MNRDEQRLLDLMRERVDASAEHECQYWLRRFEVSYTELQQAVKKVGSRVVDLERHLGRERAR